MITSPDYIARYNFHIKKFGQNVKLLLKQTYSQYVLIFKFEKSNFSLKADIGKTVLATEPKGESTNQPV